MKRQPRYPIYIPSKGRSDNCLTADCFIKDGVPFRLVIEKEQQAEYAAKYGEERLLILPFSNAGSVIPARNWIKDHATENGFERHWQFDDNISGVWRWWKGVRLYCEAGPALAATEDFVDRYENIAIAGLNYVMFAVEASKPFVINCHVYSATLVLNSIPHRWRGRYNEDTDICLQVLADGWCTLLMNAFLVQKLGTMTLRGGNTTELYQGDGRLKMARSLERLWPGVVDTKRRFNRPQHVVKASWRRFDTPLRKKPGIVINSDPNEYGMVLENISGKPLRSDNIKRLHKLSKAKAHQ